MDVFNVLKRHPMVFPLACIATALMVFISEGSYRQSVRTLDEMGAAATVRMSIHALQRSILDAETGQRGYLLTGRKEYLQPYEQALKNLDKLFQSLDMYYGKKQEPGGVL